MSSYRGRIKKLDKIIISDPSYDESVNCRYEKDIKEENWNAYINIENLYDNNEKLPFGKDIKIILSDGLPEDTSQNSINIGIKKYIIGIDTACIAFGINDKADEIKEFNEEWQPDCALKTLSDGIWGYVTEYKKDGKINMISIDGYLDADTEYTEEEILKYIAKQFEIDELVQEHQILDEGIEIE